MAIDLFQTVELIEAFENFCAWKRPPAHILPKLDMGYRIENQSVLVFEIRPRFNKPDEKIESFIAKTTFVKAKNHWKVFWMRSDLEWHSYTPKPTVKTIDEFIKEIAEDKHHCFWG
jgi:hypothetical protein